MMAAKIENDVENNIPPMKHMGMCPQEMVMVSKECQIPNRGKRQKASINEAHISGMM